jgi:hypothetical protein
MSKNKKDHKVLRVVNAFFRIHECVNRFAIEGDGIYVHFEYQPWMGNLRYLNIGPSEDEPSFVTFSGAVTPDQQDVSGDGEWDGTGFEEIQKSLGHPESAWVEFLRVNEMPATVPAVMKDMFQRGLNEAEEVGVKKQICDGLIERMAQ